MLSESDKAVIIKCAQKYHVETIYFFGSSLNSDDQALDIDLGVKGINPTLFFKFYGELMRKLSRPVDLVDLSNKTLFNAKVPLPESSTSHKDLLALAVDHEIITKNLVEALDVYRAFRHFFVHGYGILLQEAPLQPLAQNLPDIWNHFESELDAFITSLRNI